MWIDSHAHLNDEAFREDLPATITRAGEAGVGAMIVVGFDLTSSLAAVQLAEEYPPLWAAVGVHPHDAKSWDNATEERIAALLTREKVVALGEIGLDYHYEYSSRAAQQTAFRAQLRLAQKAGKPFIIHNREAHQDTMTVLKEESTGAAGGVMHCFSGSLETARECLRLGLHLSFAGPLTFANAVHLREVAAALPLEKLLVETDAPYLTPVPFRGRRNEPARVGLVGEALANLKGLAVAEVMAATAANTCRLFQMPL